MNYVDDIITLADFRQNAREHIERLKETGRPKVLTVDGKAEIVVLSVVAFQKLVDASEIVATLPVLQQSLKEADRGEGVPAATVFADIRRKLRLYA